MHLASGVLLGRAYRGCNGEARWREGFENYLPRSVFGRIVAGNGLVVDDGGGGARVVVGAGEGELRVVKRHVHEHRKSARRLLG